MFERIKQSWRDLNPPRLESEKGPCETGECGTAVTRLCPLECYQGETPAACPLAGYVVPNVLSWL